MNQVLRIETILPGLNEIINENRKHWSKGAKHKCEWQSLIGSYIKKSKLIPVNRVKLTFVWVEENNKRDPDNIAAAKKYILDALVEQKILPNDNRKHVTNFQDSFAISNSAEIKPGVIVYIEDLDRTANEIILREIKNRDKKLAGISEHEINDCAEDETEVA